jgi:prevent-host-death family protein
MRVVGVGALRQNLSKYLRAVQAGEELTVTARGRPVARLVPLGEVSAAETRRQALIGIGMLRPRIRRLPRDFWTRPKPSDRHGAVLQALRRDRTEDR